ncbi:hypothetical protein Leryth_002072 [Lithospermum erythrorhizon]|nr:hypothetical protein Leryth_002072 [Lithospermum erythrorhizon]
MVFSSRSSALPSFWSFETTTSPMVIKEGLDAFSLKLLANQMAVSLGETFPGPNGFSNTSSSSNLSSANSLALNSSNPSNASALCR